MSGSGGLGQRLVRSGSFAYELGGLFAIHDHMTCMDVNERSEDSHVRLRVFLSFWVCLLSHKSSPRWGRMGNSAVTVSDSVGSHGFRSKSLGRRDRNQGTNRKHTCNYDRYNFLDHLL